mmetsp:Transcript_616/g.894  ORF Transcript_616/g.894 Transcript_616/m.894 type:complete len:214 (-) Transcript_616:699-1340(-)
MATTTSCNSAPARCRRPTLPAIDAARVRASHCTWSALMTPTKPNSALCLMSTTTTSMTALPRNNSHRQKLRGSQTPAPAPPPTTTITTTRASKQTCQTPTSTCRLRNWTRSMTLLRSPKPHSRKRRQAATHTVPPPPRRCRHISTPMAPAVARATPPTGPFRRHSTTHNGRRCRDAIPTPRSRPLCRRRASLLVLHRLRASPHPRRSALPLKL